MQKKLLTSLIVLLQACSLIAAVDASANDASESVNVQENTAVLSTRAGMQGNQFMQQTLLQNQWQLVSFLNSSVMQAALPEHQATLLFSGRKVSGSTGCNQYFAVYQLAEQQGLQFSQAGSTMMACQGDIAQQERQYLKNLAEVRFYQIQGEQLHLIDAEQQLRLIYRAMPALTLEENVWQVTGINNGRGGVVSSAYTHQAYLQFTEGKLQGSSGCNTLAASYKTKESELSIGPVRSTRKFCAEEGIMTQEQQMLNALTQVTHYEIRTHQLRLLNTNGSLMMSLKSKK